LAENSAEPKPSIKMATRIMVWTFQPTTTAREAKMMTTSKRPKAIFRLSKAVPKADSSSVFFLIASNPSPRNPVKRGGAERDSHCRSFE